MKSVPKLATKVARTMTGLAMVFKSMANTLMSFFLVPMAGLFLLGIGFIGALEGSGDFSTSNIASGQGDYLLPWVPTPKHLRTEPSDPPRLHSTRIEEILNESLAAIYDGQYELAVKKCEDVLRIDSLNATAIGRMGSAFYLNGEQEKAVTLWKRALEMEPNNQTATNLLKKLSFRKE